MVPGLHILARSAQSLSRVSNLPHFIAWPLCPPRGCVPNVKVGALAFLRLKTSRLIMSQMLSGSQDQWTAPELKLRPKK